jgi:hypothetical protein
MCRYVLTDIHTYMWVLCKSWQLVFGQQCGKIGNGAYNCESMHHVLAMFQSYKGTCAEVHMYFKHKYHSTDSFIQTWKSMKRKRLYIKISILHGRNPWECHEELQEALSHPAVPYSTGKMWAQTFTSGRASTANMPCSGLSVSMAINEQ